MRNIIRTKHLLTMIFLALLFFSGCSPDYNTKFQLTNNTDQQIRVIYTKSDKSDQDTTEAKDEESESSYYTQQTEKDKNEMELTKDETTIQPQEKAYIYIYSNKIYVAYGGIVKLYNVDKKTSLTINKFDFINQATYYFNIH